MQNNKNNSALVILAIHLSLLINKHTVSKARARSCKHARIFIKRHI